MTMKKIYMKPTMLSVKLKHRKMIMAGSPDAYGMNNSLQNEEVEEAW